MFKQKHVCKIEIDYQVTEELPTQINPSFLNW